MNEGDWRVVSEVEREALDASKGRSTDLEGAWFIFTMLANYFKRMCLCTKAFELFKEARVIAEELGDNELLKEAYETLGSCYDDLGEQEMALVLHRKHKAIAEELGNRAELGVACGRLGTCFLK